MIADNEVYKIGHIGRTHGVKGEVTFSFTDDVWDRAEAAYLLLRVEGILLTPEASEDDEYTWRYFTGFELWDEAAGRIGTIDRVDDTTQNVLFQVGERYIPAAEDWIKDINHKARTIRMSLPEGLLDL